PLLGLDRLRRHALRAGPSLQLRPQPDHVQKGPGHHEAARRAGAVVVVEVAVDGDPAVLRPGDRLFHLATLAVAFLHHADALRKNRVLMPTEVTMRKPRVQLIAVTPADTLRWLKPDLLTRLLP